MRAISLLFVTLSFFPPSATGQTVRIGVLGIFHPAALTLSAGKKDAVVIRTAEKTIVLEPWSRSAQVRLAGNRLVLTYRGQAWPVSQVQASGRSGAAADFLLSIPGKIKRTYRGTLEIEVVDAALTPIVTMDLETAVASVVQAESDADAPLEALKAQAVVTRSYFVAGGRHTNFDFCDLTHCQFLQEPAAPTSLASTATRATQGLVLFYEERPVAAMFTRSCAGKTRTPAELGMPGGRYPYFAVTCDYCYANPTRWTRQLSPADAQQLLGKGEAGRLAIGRRLGWDAVPSNNYSARAEGDHVTLQGTGEGHGIGLCQRGAKAMASNGANFREILLHYFPNTRIVSSSLGALH